MDRQTPIPASAVARMLGVTPRTVSRWAKLGLLPSIRTPGGHRRYRPEDVERLLGAKEAASA